jgi:sterol desaturase/sphingolipid hydroxylase (fatty acid hydroxylase superfamily)
MTWPAYDPLTATWNWLVSLTGILTDPGSPFWWPTLIAAVLGFFIAALVAGANLRAARAEALPCATARFWRQLPVDIGFMVVNSAIPFLAAPAFFLLSAVGTTAGYLLMAPIFGTPASDVRLDTPGATALAAFAAFVFGDFALYWSHRVFHRVPLLWRAHRLHHAPEFLTPVTAFRFWPQEQIVHIAGAVFMTGLGLGMVATMLGATVGPLALLGVNVFTLAWNLGFSHLRHSHVALPFPRWLSHVLVSPHMHQAHHSVEDRHHDRNYATVFALWDWMFGTLYLPEAKERFRFGLGAPATEAAAQAAPAATAGPVAPATR